MPAYRFEEVAITGTKRWFDGGKRRQKTRRFYRTLNPFNANADGEPKTRAEIMDELMAERKAWMEDPDAR